MSSNVDKLAAKRVVPEGDLVPLESEREDSGIDSDAAERERRHPPSYSSDGSYSDEEPIKHDWVHHRKDAGLMKDVMDGFDSPEILRPMMQGHKRILEPDRMSPPLYEIELTASEEDDDNSVLELVIPMTTSRNRVSGSNPKKILYGVPSLFCNFFCCFRK